MIPFPPRTERGIRVFRGHAQRRTPGGAVTPLEQKNKPGGDCEENRDYHAPVLQKVPAGVNLAVSHRFQHNDGQNIAYNE